MFSQLSLVQNKHSRLYHLPIHFVKRFAYCRDSTTGFRVKTKMLWRAGVQCATQRPFYCGNCTLLDCPLPVSSVNISVCVCVCVCSYSKRMPLLSPRLLSAARTCAQRPTRELLSVCYVLLPAVVFINFSPTLAVRYIYFILSFESCVQFHSAFSRQIVRHLTTSVECRLISQCAIRCVTLAGDRSGFQ